MNKTDMQLKKDIEEELLWDPKVNAAQIGVTVDKGAVSLLGTVDTYAEKRAAETAAKRVDGVRAVAQNLEVKILDGQQRSDSEVANAVNSALTWDVLVPSRVTAKVHQGRVTLGGQVTWNFQREAAAHAIRYLTGVVAIDNSITLEHQATVNEVKERIQSALQRQGASDAESIHVDESHGKVTLSGHASSWKSMENATNAAWGVPGVTDVSDQLEITVA